MLQALGRNDFQRRWQQPVSGTVRGGPFVTAERVLVVMEGGGIRVFDAVTGIPLGGVNTPGIPVPAGPAVGGGVLSCLAATTASMRSGDRRDELPFRICGAEPACSRPVHRPGWDALLLRVLVLALLQIAGLAEQAALPNRVQDVLNHPLLGNLLPRLVKRPWATSAPGPATPSACCSTPARWACFCSTCSWIWRCLTHGARASKPGCWRASCSRRSFCPQASSSCCARPTGLPATPTTAASSRRKPRSASCWPARTLMWKTTWRRPWRNGASAVSVPRSITTPIYPGPLSSARRFSCWARPSVSMTSGWSTCCCWR